MTPTAPTEWRSQFGLDTRKSPAFFASLEEVDAAGPAAPQPHVLRRAFQQLSLDGVLCEDKTPIMYFRQLERIVPDEVASLHRAFWNHGVAPILVLIAPDEVHVYSSLAPPAPREAVEPQARGLVETLNRASNELQAFVLSVESGEYFHRHRKSFDPRQRVDRDLLRNLQAVREELDRIQAPPLGPLVLDSLLCRLVFTCYLFDRGVIDRAYLEELGIRGTHVRDILAQTPRTEAKAELYNLFERLGRDFNGDLFSDDLESEARQVRVEHLGILDRFLRGSAVRSGQGSLWPYDFGVIPIETISSIYEHFLKAAGEEEKKKAGAFYTPRFLAELVLDLALEGLSPLLDKRFLDPACGSGIFLVGLFNRLAEEWNRANPSARYDRRATALMRLLTESLYAVDKNPTACRVTAFSLYLAFLDQLSPPDIRQLQGKGKFLPRLLRTDNRSEAQGDTIRCADFFTPAAEFAKKSHLVVGNPPWGSVSDAAAPASRWSTERGLPFPDRQIATAFVWKAPDHLESGGKVCFILPFGTLFNHNASALQFQAEFVRRHAVARVVNLADYQRFLFEESEAPALVVSYAKEKPVDSAHRIEYWTPKADWAVTQAELISVLPQDRTCLTVREVLEDLKTEDAPQIWKEPMWATPRDRRLLDRLSFMPRLRDIVGQASAREAKRWLIAEGFQPLGENDDTKKGKQLRLPSRLFVDASSRALNLVLLEEECRQLPSRDVTVRGRSNKNTDVFQTPHVLITKGFSRVAFAEFHVAFRHAVRGIHGPPTDRSLLIFLTAYLRSALARYFLFHTSSNWGVSRQEVHVEELLRLPFPLPEQTGDPIRSGQIVVEVARVVSEAVRKMQKTLADRESVVATAQIEAERLVDEYFDVDGIERVLIEDTNRVIIPSVRPTRQRVDVPTIRPSNAEQRAEYTRLLCGTLNGWATREYLVHGRPAADAAIGVGLVTLQKTRRDESPDRLDESASGIMAALQRLQRGAAKSYGTLELVRGLKVFDRNLLYVTKPLGQRFWTRTAALNDADEIAGTILMRPGREGP